MKSLNKFLSGQKVNEGKFELSDTETKVLYAFVSWMQDDMRAKSSFINYGKTFETPGDDTGITKDDIDEFIQNMEEDLYFA